MSTPPAQELGLDGLDPWADDDPPHEISLSSPATSPAPDGPAPKPSTSNAKSNVNHASNRNGSPSPSLKAPIPRPFKTAPLTSPLTSLKGKEKLSTTTQFSPISPTNTTPFHSSPLHSTHTVTITSSGSSSSLAAVRSPSHPLALDDLASGARSLSLDEEYTYGAYSRTTSTTIGNSSGVHSRHRTPINRSRSGSVASPYKELDIRDVTRPALNRMTSETERQLSIGSWSAASSENGNGQREEEMDYIVHIVTQNDSLPGISLRYGIDLATLRKANRLWPSDPIHIRTEVYIPLNACRPSVTGDHIERDADGRTVLVRRRSSLDDGDSSNGVASSSKSDATISPPDEVLTVVRLPKSKMRFFPKSASAKSRNSFESDLERSADNVRLLAGSERAKNIVRHRPVDGVFPKSSSGPATPFDSHSRSPSKSSTAGESGHSRKSSRNMVRLRPPTATPPPPEQASLADRLTQLFNVPPPPSHLPPPMRPPPELRQERVKLPRAELVEMDSRPLPSSTTSSPRRRRPPTDKKRD